MFISEGAVVGLRKASPHLNDQECIRFSFGYGFKAMLRLTHKSVQSSTFLSRSHVSVNWSWAPEDEAGKYGIYLQIDDEDTVKVLEFQLEVKTSRVKAVPMRSGPLVRFHSGRRRGRPLAMRQLYRCELSKLFFTKFDTLNERVGILMYATAENRRGEVYLAEEGFAGKWYARGALERAMADMYAAR